jgi:hypothetical protein
MPKLMNRRNFVKTSAAATVLAGAKHSFGTADDTSGKKQEYYEFRIYQTEDSNKMKKMDTYLQKALLPALGRMEIDRIGVFTNMDKADDYSIYVLIPYATLNIFAAVNPKLLADKEYMRAAKDYFDVSMDDPVFTRIKSKFCKAFSGMPVIEMPAQSADNEPRIFELRIYESHTEKKAALKVDMFNSGEIQVMRDTALAPVFYGETLIGDDVPNLMYMLSASDREAHEAHWKKFREHPQWEKMKKLAKYEDTVSKITKIFFKPTMYSQI